MVLLLVLLNVVCISFTLWGVASALHKVSRCVESIDKNFQLFMKIYLTGVKD